MTGCSILIDVRAPVREDGPAAGTNNQDDTSTTRTPFKMSYMTLS